MKQSKNARVNVRPGETICKQCGQVQKARYHATMNKKANGHCGFKVKFVRECCNG